VDQTSKPHPALAAGTVTIHTPHCDYTVERQTAEAAAAAVTAYLTDHGRCTYITETGILDFAWNDVEGITCRRHHA
jgi:hypothetical protein